MTSAFDVSQPDNQGGWIIFVLRHKPNNRFAQIRVCKCSFMTVSVVFKGEKLLAVKIQTSTVILVLGYSYSYLDFVSDVERECDTSIEEIIIRTYYRSLKHGVFYYLLKNQIASIRALTSDLLRSTFQELLNRRKGLSCVPLGQKYKIPSENLELSSAWHQGKIQVKCTICNAQFCSDVQSDFYFSHSAQSCNHELGNLSNAYGIQSLCN